MNIIYTLHKIASILKEEELGYFERNGDLGGVKVTIELEKNLFYDAHRQIENKIHDYKISAIQFNSEESSVTILESGIKFKIIKQKEVMSFSMRKRSNFF